MNLFPVVWKAASIVNTGKPDGLSRAALAKACDVDPSVIKRLGENVDLNINTKVVDGLARKLGTDAPTVYRMLTAGDDVREDEATPASADARIRGALSLYH